jgi:hypothetical protein
MKLNMFILTVLLVLGAKAQHHPHTAHGFILLGDKQLHAYHLARFNSPHEYQVLFELTLTDNSGNKVDISQIRKNQNNTVLSLASEDHFLISDINAITPIKSFKIKLFSGYLRDQINRKLLLEDVQLAITKVTHFRKISKDEIFLSNKKMILVCDQYTNQFYLANTVQGINVTGNSFEEILSVTPYIGSAGENSSSYIPPCTDAIQGSTVSILQNYTPAANEIYNQELSLSAKFQNQTYALFVDKIIIQDNWAINN